MLLLFFHGDLGGLDELVIAVVAIGVLWLAVKLAGRKSADGDEEDEEQDEEESATGEAHTDEAAPTR
jgi:hypothetical protein